MDRYTDLLAYPPFLAVALENIGINLAVSGGLRILDRNTLELENLHGSTLRFLKQAGHIFTYSAKVYWNVPPLSPGFEIPVELNVAKIKQGKVTVSVYSSMANLLPKAFEEGIQQKVQELFNADVQSKFLDYIKKLRKGPQKEIDTHHLVQLILLQAYNRRGSFADEVVQPNQHRDVERLSDQVILLVTIIIWLVAVPATAVLIFFWRRKFKP